MNQRDLPSTQSSSSPFIFHRIENRYYHADVAFDLHDLEPVSDSLSAAAAAKELQSRAAKAQVVVLVAPLTVAGLEALQIHLVPALLPPTLAADTSSMDFGSSSSSSSSPCIVALANSANPSSSSSSASPTPPSRSSSSTTSSSSPPPLWQSPALSSDSDPVQQCSDWCQKSSVEFLSADCYADPSTGLEQQRNEFQERVGVARLVEVLHAQEWPSITPVKPPSRNVKQNTTTTTNSPATTNTITTTNTSPEDPPTSDAMQQPKTSPASLPGVPQSKSKDKPSPSSSSSSNPSTLRNPFLPSSQDEPHMFDLSDSAENGVSHQASSASAASTTSSPSGSASSGSDTLQMPALNSFEKSLSHLSGLREHLKTLPSDQRREMAAQVALWFAAQFDADGDDEVADEDNLDQLTS